MPNVQAGRTTTPPWVDDGVVAPYNKQRSSVCIRADAGRAALLLHFLAVLWAAACPRNRFIAR